VKLAHFSEEKLVASLVRGLPLASDVRVGPGDDCAVIGRPRDATWLLLKTDAVIEGVHFLPTDAMRRVGWKALCRAISDIGAMGGEPRHALVTIALSPEMEVAQARELYAGLRRAAREFGVSIVGGETARSPGPMFVNVALTGSVDRSRCVLRSGARPGDVLFVTGRLGGSRAGHHLDFRPRVAEARWLTTNSKLRAMMDLSDGLAADLPRLAAASGCSYHLNEAAVPRNRGCSTAQALSDGEDYELLLALRARDASPLEIRWGAKFPRLPLTRIGVLEPLTAKSSEVPPHRAPSGTTQGQRTLNSLRGFDHFA